MKKSRISFPAVLSKYKRSAIILILLIATASGYTQEPPLIPRKVFDCTPSYDYVNARNEHVQRHLQVPFRIMGISPSLDYDYLHVNVFEAGWQALKYPIAETKAIGSNLYGIVFGHEKADPGGPKRIYDEFSKAWKVGWRHGLELLIALSVYLGLFNLFPLPALDGGRLVFLIYEMVTRRRANPRIEAMVHMGGIMVLGVVMILVTLRDCGVLFS